MESWNHGTMGSDKKKPKKASSVEDTKVYVQVVLDKKTFVQMKTKLIEKGMSWQEFLSEYIEKEKAKE